MAGELKRSEVCKDDKPDETGDGSPSKASGSNDSNMHKESSLSSTTRRASLEGQKEGRHDVKAGWHPCPKHYQYRGRVKESFQCPKYQKAQCEILVKEEGQCLKYCRGRTYEVSKIHEIIEDLHQIN